MNQKRRKGCRRIAVAFGLLFLAGLLGCRMMMPEELKVSAAAANRFEAAHPKSLSMQGNLHVAEIGPDTYEATLFFVHGSPGDWTAAAMYLEDSSLATKYRIVSMDRPGYGGSPKLPEFRLNSQADALAALTGPADGKRIWIGHSFGAPIAAKVAVRHPGKVDGLVLLAGAYDPALERPRWYNKVSALPVIRSVLPRDLMSANEEVYNYEADLGVMESAWAGIAASTLVIHCEKDALASPEGVSFVESRMPGATIEWLPEGGHLILWNHQALLAERISSFAESLNPR